MKLNNKGWSLNTLLICMAIILSFLLISVLYVYKLSNEFTSNLTGVNNSTNYSNNNSSVIVLITIIILWILNNRILLIMIVAN